MLLYKHGPFSYVVNKKDPITLLSGLYKKNEVRGNKHIRQKTP